MAISYRKQAGDKAAASGLQRSHIDRNGKKADCLKYLADGIWSDAWGIPKQNNVKKVVTSEVVQEKAAVPNVSPAKEHLPVDIPSVASVKEPLTEGRPIKTVKGMLANGRNKKSMPAIENWFAQIVPIDTAFPAWRALTKTATDVAIICKAKSGRAAKKNEKDKTGIPMFAFTVSEAEKIFKLTRPTFTKAIHLLLEIGFIEQIRSGGVVNGNGIKALYRLSDKWKSWNPPPKDNTNIFKARLARKQNPRKGALNGLGKGAFNGYD